MRLAVFTSDFPGRINTFFAQDMRGLLDAGVDIDVFAIHPLDARLWSYVPDILSERVLPRSKVHHVSMTRAGIGALMNVRGWAQGPEMAAIAASGLTHGPAAALKTGYVLPKALAWARRFGRSFDHVLAYWGNYAATCAYLFHRAAGEPVPFTTFLHAGTDLYRSRVYLEQKLAYADNIVVVCEFNRAFLQATFPARFAELGPKIYVHHLGVDVDALRSGEHVRPTNLLVAVGGLHPGKGFDDLLRALAELRRGGRDVQARIVGGGPEEPKLRRLAMELGVAPGVVFTGWQSPERAVEEIRQATVLIDPSIGLGDAVPTVIKEAMALGTPVVGSAVAGIPELLDGGRCGILTPPRNPTALANGIAMLLDAPDLQKAHALAARARAEKCFSAAHNSACLAERLRRTPRRTVAAPSAREWWKSSERHS